MREEKIKMGEATDVFDMTKKKKGPQAQFQLSKSAACLVIASALLHWICSLKAATFQINQPQNLLLSNHAK